MKPESKPEPGRVRELFVAAVGKVAPEQRDAFLREEAGGDEALAREVLLLLEAHDESDGFLDAPALDRTLSFGDRLSEGPGTTIGPYKLLEPIGEGGMGVVYMAEQTRPVRRKVALKVIKPGMDSKQVVARFEAERQALALMDHPNIARVLDAGTTDSGRPYFVMELVKGIPITAYCDQERLSIDDRLDLFILVCQAVQHAHQKGVIHRDIKPSNVLITLHDGAPVPKVIDFGVAKATGQSLTDKTLYTGFAQLIGTPLYMSPEQAELSGLDVDTRSDIYSLGVLLYELLTGTTPFDQDTFRTAALDEMRRIIREEEPPKPSTRIGALGATLTTVSANRKADSRRLSHSLRGELDWVVMKALEKDRKRRYETASGFAADVRRHLADQPVEACPPSAWYRFGKFARRNRTAFIMAALFTAAIGIGLAASLWFAVAATLAEKKSTAALGEARTNFMVAEAHRAEAVAQERQAKLLLSRSLIQSGTRRLEEGTALGLFDLIDAHAAAEHDPELREASARLWAAGIAPLEDRLAAILDGWFLAFSPDGMLIATASGASVTLWETTTWRRRGAPLGHGPGMEVVGVAFSPDGSTIATSTHGGGVRLWDVTTGRVRGSPLREETKHETSPSGSLAFSPDGKLLSCWSPNGQVLIWDTATGQAHGPPLSHAGPVRHVAFSPDGMMLATGSDDATARIWDVKSGEPISPPLRQEDMIHAMAFSPDGTLLATSSGLCKTRLWGVRSGRLHCEPLVTKDWVISLAFSPDSKLLATGDTAWTAQLWDTATGRAWGKPLRHEARVTSVHFSPDGRLLATRSLSGLTRVWDVWTQKVSGLPLPADTRNQGRASFSPDGRLLAVGGNTGTRVWRVSQKPWTATFEHEDSVWAIDLSPDGKRLATASGSDMRIWDVDTGRHLRYPLTDVSVDTTNYPFMPSSVLFSPDGELLAVIDSPRTVRLLDAATCQTVGRSMAHPGRVQNLAFSPDGRRLVTSTLEKAAEQSTLRLFETATQVLISTHTHESLCLAMSPGGRQLAIGNRSWRARIWELADELKLNRVLYQGEWCLCLDYSANGSCLATGTAGGLVHLWAASTGEHRGPPVRLEGPVKKVQLSPDGKLLATAEYDRHEGRHGPVRLWDLTVSPPYPSVTLPQSDGTLSLALTADGRWLAIGQEDGTARLLRMPTLPVTTRELRLRTWIALGTRASEGDYQTIAMEEWQALRHGLRPER